MKEPRLGQRVVSTITALIIILLLTLGAVVSCVALDVYQNMRAPHRTSK